MRRTFAVALSVALAGGLALAALGLGATDRSRIATLGGADAGSARLAGGASDKWKGRFKQADGAKIIIKAKTEGGVPTKIKKMAYRNLPADCPVSGVQPISGGWTLAGVFVGPDRKFKAKGDDGDPVNPSTLRFKGKFTPDYDKVKGRFQTSVYFGPDNPPEETCTTEPKRYVAKR